MSVNRFRFWTGRRFYIQGKDVRCSGDRSRKGMATYDVYTCATGIINDVGPPADVRTAAAPGCYTSLDWAVPGLHTAD